jgi:flagellar biosynthesis protein FliP
MCELARRSVLLLLTASSGLFSKLKLSLSTKGGPSNTVLLALSLLCTFIYIQNNRLFFGSFVVLCALLIGSSL